MVKDWLVDRFNAFFPYAPEVKTLGRLRRRLYLSQLRRKDILAWRLEVAREAGMKIGQGCRLFSFNVFSEPYLVELGNNVIVSGLVKFITHDGAVHVQKGMPENLVGHFGRIRVGSYTFIGMDATIMPNVEIGSNCIVGAGAVVFESIPDDSVVAGNPAKVQFKTSMYLKMKKNSKYTVHCDGFPPFSIPPERKRSLLENDLPDIPRRREPRSRALQRGNESG